MTWSFYREKAAQYHRLAEAASQTEIRQSYETLERHWNEIAALEDRRISTDSKIECLMDSRLDRGPVGFHPKAGY